MHKIALLCSYFSAKPGCPVSTPEQYAMLMLMLIPKAAFISFGLITIAIFRAVYHFEFSNVFKPKILITHPQINDDSDYMQY